ncbi:MAG TPA: hypothetical protein VMH02_07940, partial [Verrucomicrobiae bacterium]|nr:hypothetical protein [Verrucomicrobiae bacterium]
DPYQTYYPRELTQDTNGNVWFTDGNGGRVFKNPVAGPYDGSALVGYTLPNTPYGNTASGQGIQYGSDGNVYVVDSRNAVVDRVDPSNGTTLTQIALPQEKQYLNVDVVTPNFMTQDSSGTLLLTYFQYAISGYGSTFGGVDSLVPGAASMTALALPSTPSGSEGYGISANGSNVYYVDFYGGLGYINASTGKSRLYRIISLTGNFSNSPSGVVAMPDGTAWFTCYGSGAPPLCLGHTVYLKGWSLFPGPTFTIQGFGALNAQPVGIMEAPTASSGPFSAASSNTSACTASTVTDHNFLVTGVAPGACTVTVKDANGKSAQLQVTVEPVPTATPGAERARRPPPPR